MKSKNLSIAGISLRKDRINSGFLKTASAAIDSSTVRKGKNAALEALKGWTESPELDQDSYQAFKDYAVGVKDKYSDLQSKWWDAHNAEDTKAKHALEERMMVEGEVLLHQKKLETELREATALAATQAIAGSLAGPAGVVAAYAAYSNSTGGWTSTETENIESVLKELNALQDGTSTMITEGNAVEQVHRSKLWKTMNDLLDGAIKDAEKGKPVEIDLQLYELTSFEIINKLALAAKAGNKVRLNLDPGRLAFPSRDSEGDSYFSLDATPDKVRTILQLTQLKNADVAVSLFPPKQELNSASDLMHRKVMRVGDKVLVSGMNANLGSGENVDSGYLVKGKAATKLAENLARDIQTSKGATLEDIWGEHHIKKFEETNLKLGKRGFIALLDSLGGPSPAGTEMPDIETFSEFEKLAKKAGVNFVDLVTEDPENLQSSVERMLSGRYLLTLSDKGKDMLQSLIGRAIEATNSEDNLKKLDDIELPSTRKVGNARVDVADSPVEREALVLSAISQAEEFVYMPAFVVTRAVAAALVARKEQVEAGGGHLDVRVVADSALYPHGGTPNSFGVKFLEDHGIQPRWSKLERSGDHDRKIHAKQMITERGEVTGSTNFSNKGLRENWETSVFVHFDKNDKKSMAAKDESIQQFETLWDRAYEVNSLQHSALFKHGSPAENSEWLLEEGRDSAIKHTLNLLGNYERETGKFHQSLLENDQRIADKFNTLRDEGYSYGDSLLQAAESVLGTESYRGTLASFNSEANLDKLQKMVEAKSRGEDPGLVVDSGEEASGPSEDVIEELMFS